MPLAVVTRSGTTPSCSQANQSPVRANPVCTSSATNTMPLRRQYSASPAGSRRRGHDEPALALDRLDHHAATFPAPTCASIAPVTAASASAPHCSGPVGQR